MKKIVMSLGIIVGLSSCTWFNDAVKGFESNTIGLARKVYIYSYTGELIKSYQGNSVRLKSDETGRKNNILVDGKRITVNNAIVITEEE